ncbi:hypothetical protein FNI15_19300 [Salmonella enterica subsp. salamae]|nr:hypothetical protein [Salmonella enterica subsp. salamae]
MRYYILLLLLFFSIDVSGEEVCEKEPEYLEYYHLKQELENSHTSNEKVYHILKQQIKILETCYEKPREDLYDFRNKMYSYKIKGNKIKASNIYDCDSISSNNLCLKKGRVDWDWTDRIYPRSSSTLRRPIPDKNNIEFPFRVDGYELATITLTYIDNLGNKINRPIKHKKNNNYVYASVNVSEVYDKKIVIDNQFSNSWLIVIYKNTNGKYLKAVWYYAE